MASSTSSMPMPGNPGGGTNDSSYSVKQLDSIGALSAKFNKLKTDRAMLDIQWKLNLAYYGGRQYTYYNKSAQKIEELPTSDGEKPRYRIRLKSNQIMPGSQGLLAKMTKTKPVINATPGSSDPKDVRAAQFCERLQEFWWNDMRLDEKLEEVLLWAIVCSQGYWLTTWDAQAGKAMKFTIGPDGNPITDTNLRSQFLQELVAQGIQPEQVEKTFYMGDVRVEVVSPFNVYLDPAAKSFERCKYAMVASYLDPDEVYARWGKWVQPDSSMTNEDTLSSLAGQAGSMNSVKSTCRIVTAYFVPSSVLPKGRIVTWAESGQVQLEDGDWTFPDHSLPLTKFGILKVPGSLYDSSVVEHAIPMQQELNRTISQIVEYKNLTIKPRVWAPVGSLRRRLTNEPGAVYEYTPIAGLKPEIEVLPSMPPYVFTHLEDISARLKAAFYTTEVEGGTLPPNVEAFASIDLLQELSSDQIAPAVKLMEKSIGYAGQKMLGIAQRYYVEPRLLMIKGANGSPTVKEFSRADIVGGVSITVESGSGLPRTRAGRMASIQNLVDKGYISPQTGLKRMGIADLNGPLADIAADEDQALREHDKLIARQPLNTDALRQAIQTVQTPDPQFGAPVNPDTGKPFASMQEIQQFVHNASLSPLPYENYQANLEQHALWMKSADFETLPPDIQADAINHFNQTFQIIINLPVPGVKGPAVNLQVKSTAGVDATAKILRRAGVTQITPQDLQEDPLPTWISESIGATSVVDPSQVSDPADPTWLSQSLGANHETGLPFTAATPVDPGAVAKADQTVVQTHKAAQAADVANAQQLQTMAHAERLHQQSHQHAEELHQAKLAKLKEKPDPGKAK